MEPEGSLPCSQQPANGPYLDQMRPVHNFTPYFSKIHSIIIFPFTPRSSKSSVPFRFSTNIMKYYTAARFTHSPTYMELPWR